MIWRHGVRLFVVILVMWFSDSAVGRGLAAAKWPADFSPWEQPLYGGNAGQRPPQLIVQSGKGMLQAAAFSPDGKLALIGDDNGGTRIFETVSGREVRRLKSHAGPVASVSFSPDGKVAITAGSEDMVVRFLDVETGREVQEISHSGGGRLTGVAVSHDGKYVITAGADDTALLWNLGSGKQIARLKGMSVAFSPVDNFAVTGSRTGSAWLWDVGTGGKQMGSFEGHSSVVDSVAFSSDGRYVVTGSWDKTACLWDIATGRQLQRFTGHSDFIYSVAFSPDGRFVATASQDQSTRIWDPGSGKETKKILGKIVNRLTFSSDGKFMLLASIDGAAKMLSAKDWTLVRSLGGGSAAVLSVSVSRDGRFALTGSEDGVAHFWDISTGAETKRFSRTLGAVQSVVLSPDTRLALTGAADGSARLWDVTTGEQRAELGGHLSSINSVAFSHDGALALTGDSDGVARIWQVATATEIQRLSIHGSMITFVAFSPDKSLVITQSSDSMIRVWNTMTGSELRSFGPVPLGSAAISPDGRLLLSSGWNGDVEIWDLNDSRRLYSMSSGQKGHTQVGCTGGAAFTTDGRFAITACHDDVVRAWEVATGKQIKVLEGHSDFVTSVAISGNPDRIMSGCVDGTTRIWQLETGRPLATLASFDDDVWGVASPESRFDSNDLEALNGMHWRLNENATTLFPLEVFMRDYYEPRLLPRLLAGEQMPKVRSLQDLNLAQPKVRIVSVDQGERRDMVMVKVEASSAEAHLQVDGKVRTMRTDAYDLRLFRGGQLVGQWPELNSSVEESLRNGVVLSAEELRAWREARRVKLDATTGKTERTFAVRLPHGKAGKQIEFTSYAFNEDRVKSETARASYFVPKDAGPVRKHAYVIAMGVNAYQRQGWNLHFAVSDARLMQRALTKRLSGYEVVPVTMISDCRTAGCPDDGDRSIGENRATKAALHAVLEKLAGHELSAELAKSLPPGAEKVEKAEPDDLVLLSVSSHGYTSKEGTFYMIPSDSGDIEGKQITRALPVKWISSDELSRWLQDVDAGDLVMILDTCHSAATVEEPGFKPGPMGSRGLGQLAYDKGMRILAASQADDVALESEKLKQGLLTYALVENGLEERQAVGPGGKGEITLDSWLQYGADRVPTLYQEVRVGKVQNFGATKKETVVDEKLSNGSSSLRKPNTFQQPSFFNFQKHQLPIVLR
jgi:WD40 repeat protein